MLNFRDIYKSMTLIITMMTSAKKAGRLKKAIFSRILNYIRVLPYFIYNPASKKVRIHTPKPLAPSKDQNEINLVKRLFKAYKLMKEDEIIHSKYLPSSLWKLQLDNSFSELKESKDLDNFELFHNFLSNFGTSEKYLGIENQVLIKRGNKNIFGRLYLQNFIFYKTYKLWKWFYNDRKTLDKLSYPTYGNQCGAYLYDKFVGAGSFFNEIYGSTLSKLVEDSYKPVVGEIGGGYGKLAYFTLRDLKNYCYVGFDLPEIITLQAYYLSKCFPSKVNLFYGESEFNKQSFKNFDLIFMPCFEIEKLEKESIDLFINKNSFGEMEEETVLNYLNFVCNSTNYLFHLNHDNYRNYFDENNYSLLGSEYPIPSKDFKLLIRYPDLGHLIGRHFIDPYQDIFFYLYEKKYKSKKKY